MVFLFVECLHSFIAWFFALVLLWYGFFFLPIVIRTWLHSIFGISISSHVALTYIQHNYPPFPRIIRQVLPHYTCFYLQPIFRRLYRTGYWACDI